MAVKRLLLLSLFNARFTPNTSFRFEPTIAYSDYGSADIRRITNQQPLSPITKSRRLTFFGHLARTDENADAIQTIFEPPPENWRRPPGRPRTTWTKNIHDNLSSLDLGIYEARDLAQNWPLWRLMSLCTALHATIGLDWTVWMLDPGVSECVDLYSA